MVWRIHFTEDDLSRVQVSPTLGPLAETVMAVSLLRCPQPPRKAFREWHGQVRSKVTPRMRPLTALIPPGCHGVDLYTLTGETTTIEAGVQALLEVPREQLLVEMEYVDRLNRLPASSWTMAETGELEELAEAVEVAYRELVQPYWPRISTRLHAAQAARRRTLAREGAARLLASLQGQQIRWRPPVLEVLIPGQGDMYLEGKGLMLVPSVFVGAGPTLHENPNKPMEPPRLIVPAGDSGIGHPPLWDGPRRRGAALAALVGRNRAAVLGCVADGCTTSELAERVGISIAAASQHVAVLRGAGLVISHRQGSAVLHMLTPLGAELLQAG
jgi:DNA-binding transcriptional ArsR family regulator